MKINQCLNATLILLLSTACLSFAQVAPEDGSLTPDANRPVEFFTPAGDLDMATNTVATPEALAARIATAAQLAAATNAGPSSSKEPQVRSASFGSPPPPARWVAEADGRFTTENTAFQAILAGTLNVEGALTVAIPDAEPGTYLRGTILVLAYCEPGELGRSVTIATSRPVQGQLQGPDRVIFKEAFAGEGDVAVVADVVYHLTAYSIAQDVVIRGRLPGPEYYGLSAESALTVVSEFYAPPAPLQRAGTDGEPDVMLQWGRMGMIRGKAFGLGEESDSSLNVRKTWAQVQGRSVLLESLPYSRIKNKMDALPVLESLPSDETIPTGPDGEGGSLGPLQQNDMLLAGSADLFRSLPIPWASISACPLALDATGFVIDYVLTWPQPIISINFAGAVKTGFAAVGQSGSDSWNQYSFQNNGTLQNLHWTDSAGNNSGASVTVANASGNWNFTCCMPSIDNMYDSYLYQYGSAMTVTVNSLPAGTYHFYIYGHGPAQNANTIFTFGTTNLSTSATDPYWNTALWTNGLQYVIYSNITVTTGQQISFTAAPGVSSYALLNGMQIVPVNTLPAPPTITSHPQSVTVGQGGSANFSVSATGTAPLSYQWRKGGVNIGGATASSYTIVGVQPADAGSYSVDVSNAGGTTPSGSAWLTVTGPACVTPPPGIMGWWPGDAIPNDLARGHAVTLAGGAGYAQATVGPGFSLNGTGAHAVVPSASSGGDLNVGTSSWGFSFEAWIKPSDSAYRPIFEWCISTPTTYGVHFWANYPGAGYLYANIMDTGGSSHPIQASGVLTVNTLTHVAVTYDKNAGGVAKLFVNGVKRAETTLGVFTPQTSVDFYLGFRALGLGWGGACFYGLIDEPSVYNRPLSESEVNAIYTAGGSGKCKTPPPTPPTITTQPQAQTVTAWNDATFTVGVNGTPPISYQWKLNGTDIAGATGSSYTRQHAEPTHAGVYSVYVSNAAGNATSAGATLAVNEANTDADPLPDWWEMKFFGSLGRDGSLDYDGDGTTDATEYEEGKDPNKIVFTTTHSDDHITAATVSGNIIVTHGVPSWMSIVIDTTAVTTWVPYNSSFTATLPPGDGDHTVWVALRGLAEDSAQSWDGTRITRDTTAPQIVITSPTTTTTSRPIVQFQGYSPEALASIVYDLNNASGTITDQAGFVTDQHYDTSLQKFTTTYFQCFDIELATGANTLTLRATDLAGNTSTAIYAITLSYAGDTTAPVMTLYSPINNAHLCGDTFSLRGFVDDPTATITAQVTAPDNTLTSADAIVERDGLFWIENLPIAAGGANTVLLTATDAASNLSTTSIALYKDSVTMAIASFQAHEPDESSASVTVNISPSAGYKVWINGVAASDQGGGVWSTANVPLPAGGTALVQVRAIPTSDNGGNGTGGGTVPTYQNPGNPNSPQAKDLESEKDRKPFLYGNSYREYWSLDILKPNPVPRDLPYHHDETTSWSYGGGGTSATGSDFTYSDLGPNHSYCNSTWPEDLSWEPSLEGVLVCGDDWFGPGETQSIAPPMIPGEHCQVIDARPEDVYSRSAQTTFKLRTGGKASSKRQRQNLFVFGASADHILDTRYRPQSGNPVNSQPIASEEIKIGSLGTLGSDGKLYKVLGDNQTIDVTPRVKSKKFNTFSVSPQKHLVVIRANGVPLESGRVVPGGTCCVGHKIVFSVDLDPALSISSQEHHWYLPAKYVNAWEEFHPAIGDPLIGDYYKTTCHPVQTYLSRGVGSEGPPDAPYCKNYLQENWPLNQAETGGWWYSGGRKVASCYWNITLPNGQQAALIGRGLIDVHKPTFTGFSTTNPDFPISPRSFLWDLQTLSYGDVASGEPSLYWSITVNSAYDGTLGILQLVNAKYTQNYGYPWPLGRDTLDTHGEYWLDGNEPNYEESQYFVSLPASHSIFLNDHPSEELYAPLPTNVRVWGTFRDFLRFKPSGSESIFVTLAINGWSMEGKASVGIDVNSTPAPSEPVVSDEFPMWLRVHPAR